MRLAALPLAAILLLAGCAGKTSSATRNAEWGAVGAVAGASEALFRFDLVGMCWIIGRDGGAAEQSVSGICQATPK